MNARNIQVRHDITIDRDVLSHLQSVGVRQPFSIKFPGNFGGGIPAGNTLQKHTRSRLKSLFGKGLTNLRRLDCRSKKRKDNSIDNHSATFYIPVLLINDSIFIYERITSTRITVIVVKKFFSLIHENFLPDEISISIFN